MGAVRALLEAARLPVEGLSEQFPSAYVVAVQGEHRSVIGGAGLELHGRWGLLRSLVVADTVRGRGVGRGLVENRLAHARAARIERVFLLTTTASTFFEELEFKAVPRSEVPSELAATPEFSGVCPASALCLCRTP